MKHILKKLGTRKGTELFKYVWMMVFLLDKFYLALVACLHLRCLVGITNGDDVANLVALRKVELGKVRLACLVVLEEGSWTSQTAGAQS